MDAFIGEIRVFAGNFAPQGWAICNGAIISINDNQALFSLIGTAFGGDGISNFALPNLSGRLPIGFGQGPGLSSYALGQAVGQGSVTLTVGATPAHSHVFQATTELATSRNPGANMFAALPADYVSYVPSDAPGTTTRALDGTALTPFGAGQAHDNHMPTLALTYIICLEGIYPSFQ